MKESEVRVLECKTGGPFIRLKRQRDTAKSFTIVPTAEAQRIIARMKQIRSFTDFRSNSGRSALWPKVLACCKGVLFDKCGCLN